MLFQDLGLCEPLLRAILMEGYETATPIQIQAIGPVMEGRDVIGCAQTGTGKTAAFALPILHRMIAEGNPPRGNGRKIRCLVLASTRELASQIRESFATYGHYTPLRMAAIFGGVSQAPQERLLRHGIDILIATPGRLLDLIQQGFVDLKHIETLVLDEADRMLDMGFLPAIREVISYVPKVRQTLLFSATMPPLIRELAESILRNPIHISIEPETKATETVQQSVFHVAQGQKTTLLIHLLKTLNPGRGIVFTRTKHGADRVVKHLLAAGVRAEALHSNKSQNQRLRILESFKWTNPPILVATDIAARGIDVDDVSHVFNFDLPHEVETYVHRIGRSGRAGASGIAISFCDTEEKKYLRGIEKFIGKRLPSEGNTDEHLRSSRSNAIEGSSEPRRGERRSGDASSGRDSRTSKGSRTNTSRGDRTNAPNRSRPSGSPGPRTASNDDRRPRSNSVASEGTREQQPKSSPRSSSNDSGASGSAPPQKSGIKKRFSPKSSPSSSGPKRRARSGR